MCWCARACVCVCVCLFCSILYPFWPLSKKPFPTFRQYTNDFSSFDKHIIGYLLHSGGRDLRREVSSAQPPHLDHTFTSSPISIDTILCHSLCHQLMNVIQFIFQINYNVLIVCFDWRYCLNLCVSIWECRFRLNCVIESVFEYGMTSIQRAKSLWKAKHFLICFPNIFVITVNDKLLGMATRETDWFNP